MDDNEVKDDRINKIRDFVIDSIRWKKSDFEFEKSKDPDSYRCGFSAGRYSALLMVAEYIDQIMY